jgi:hypothetical protein
LRSSAARAASPQSQAGDDGWQEPRDAVEAAVGRLHQHVVAAVLADESGQDGVVVLACGGVLVDLGRLALLAVAVHHAAVGHREPAAVAVAHDPGGHLALGRTAEDRGNGVLSRRRPATIDRQQNERRGGRVGRDGRSGKREGRVGQEHADAERQQSESHPHPVDERVDVHGEARRLGRGVEGGEHQVDVLREAAMDGHLGGRRFFVLAEDPLGRIHLGERLPVTEHGDVRRDHLLLAVVGDRQGIVAHHEVAHRHLLPRFELRLFLLLEAFAREAEEISTMPR